MILKESTKHVNQKSLVWTPESKVHWSKEAPSLSVVNSLPNLAGLGRVLQSIVVVGFRFSHFRWFFHHSQSLCHWSNQCSCSKKMLVFQKEFVHPWIWNNPNVIVHQCSVNSLEVILSLSFCRTSRCWCFCISHTPSYSCRQSWCCRWRCQSCCRCPWYRCHWCCRWCRHCCMTSLTLMLSLSYDVDVVDAVVVAVVIVIDDVVVPISFQPSRCCCCIRTQFSSRRQSWYCHWPTCCSPHAATSPRSYPCPSSQHSSGQCLW